MSDAFAEMMLGHLVCLVQGNAFILVEWAYLGRGKLRWPVLWAELLCMGQLGLSLATGMSFFNVQSVLLNVLYLFVTAQLFGGNFADKLTACLINGTMCLLVENTVNYTYSWFTGVRTGEAWQHPGCLIALCAANLIVGAAVAHSLYSWNQKCALQPLQALVMSFFPPLPLIAIVALNVAAHGGLLGFLYSWAGVALGGIIMFLFWRRLIKRFFWKVASRSPKLEKAQQWVNRFDTSSLFMLSLLPFTPTSFMHFAFGMSDFDEKRYLRAVLLGKGLMVAMMAVFGQSLVSSLKNPVYLVLAVLLWGGMYWVSKRFCRKHHLE